jgi:N-acetyl-alpha-D-muramate 1-phosphate uridylyltransferase
MQAAIIAGGLATRLGELTQNLPKSLIKICGKPFIEYQFDFLKKAGVFDIVLCLGYLGEPIQEYCGNGNRFGVNLHYSFEKERLDTAGALKLASPLLEDPFFTLYGDSYVSLDFQDMLHFFENHHKMAAMSVYQNEGKYDQSNTAIEMDFVTQYRKVNTDDLHFIDYGVNLFHKEVLDLIPGSQPYSMGALFQDLISLQELLAFEVKERFYQIGSLEGLKECTEYIDRMR